MRVQDDDDDGIIGLIQFFVKVIIGQRLEEAAADCVEFMVDDRVPS